MSKTLQDFYHGFNVFNNVLVIFGLSSMQPTYKTNAVVYELSWKCVLYSMSLVFVIIYVFYLQVTEFFPAEQMEENLVLKILYWYLAVVGTVMAILMIATAISNANHFADLLNNPEYFEMYTLPKSYGVLRYASAKQLCLCFSILTLCYVWDFSSAYGRNIRPKHLIHILLYFLFPIYNSLCISQFYISLYWLGRLYQHINDSLRELMVSPENSSQANQDMNAFSVIEMTNTYSIRQSSNMRYCGKDPAVVELVRIRTWYHKTFKLSENINGIFSTRNLLLILHHCALGTVYVYWAIRHSLRGVHVSLTTVLNMYRAAFMSLVSIMWIVWPSTHTRREVGKTALLVHELSKAIHNTEARNEMLGAVTSYLAILLQYHIMYVELQSTRNSTVV